MERPSKDEFAESYRAYVSLVPDGDIARILARQEVSTAYLLGRIREDRADHRYAPGKWSVREVMGHLADTERVMAYRMLRIARGDETPMAGFEETEYVRNGRFERRSLESLVNDIRTVRRATLSLVDQVDDETSIRVGIANDHPISVRALAYVIAGHELHHLSILRERYGVID